MAPDRLKKDWDAEEPTTSTSSPQSYTISSAKTYSAASEGVTVLQINGTLYCVKNFELEAFKMNKELIEKYLTPKKGLRDEYTR